MKDNQMFKAFCYKQPSTPAEYASELKHLVEGSSPADPLYEMYDPLNAYASLRCQVRQLIKDAFEHAEDRSVNAFRQARAELISIIDEHIASLKPNIFTYNVD